MTDESYPPPPPPASAARPGDHTHRPVASALPWR